MTTPRGRSQKNPKAPPREPKREKQAIQGTRNERASDKTELTRRIHAAQKGSRTHREEGNEGTTQRGIVLRRGRGPVTLWEGINHDLRYCKGKKKEKSKAYSRDRTRGPKGWEGGGFHSLGGAVGRSGNTGDWDAVKVRKSGMHETWMRGW